MRNFACRSIGPPAKYQIAGDEDGRGCFQHYDPKTGEVTFLTTAVKVRDPYDEAKRILDLPGDW